MVDAGSNGERRESDDRADRDDRSAARRASERPPSERTRLAGPGRHVPILFVWFALSLVVVGVAIALDKAAEAAFIGPVSLAAGEVVLIGFVLIGIAFGCLAALYGDGYEATLWALAPLVPGMAAAGTVAAALGPSSGSSLVVDPNALVVGTLGAVGIWAVGSAPLRGVAAANIAQTRSNGLLRQRHRQLTDRLVEIEGAVEPTGGRVGARMALREARRQLDWVLEDMGPEDDPTSGLRWVSATGYVNAQRALNRAEEALIDAEPVELLLGDALHDYYSLRNSRIPSSQELMAGVRKAVARIDPTVAAEFFEDASSPMPETPAPGNGAALPTVRLTEPAIARIEELALAESGGRTRRSGVADGIAASASSAEMAAGAARLGGATSGLSMDELGGTAASRAVLREIRFAVNDFREGALDGLVRARNRLWRTILLTALTTYLLLALAVMSRTDKNHLVAAVALFLVGAIVGLFNRLRIEGSANSAVEDFGLFEARLLHTPVVSGLAGIAGVFLVAVVSPAALSSTAGASLELPTLGEIFDLTAHPPTLAIGAVFGLAPGLIIDRLQRETDGLKNDLRSAEPATKAETLTSG